MNPKDIHALLSYSSGAVQRLFAANATALFDVTAVPSPTVSPTPIVDGLKGGDWSSVQFSTPGGTFLKCVNGADIPLAFDGAAWSSTPAITGVDPTVFSHIWAFKNRLFFVEKGSMNAWYLPVDSIGGEAKKLPLGAVFNRGGSLLFGSTWSVDAGDGMDEKCAFLSTEGEVAVYGGSDPSSANAWSLIGVYRVGRPLGKNAWIKAGGDLIVATDIGFVPLSQAVNKDVAALAIVAVSYPIETAWNDEVEARGSQGWACEVWPTKQMVLVAMPAVAGRPDQLFVANARTGAWALYTNWNVTCLRVFGERLFFGSTDGRIIEGEISGRDTGGVFTAECVPLFDDFKTPASLKTMLQARAVMRVQFAVNAKVSAQYDFAIQMPTKPDAAAQTPASIWGVAVWGESRWGAAIAPKTQQQWVSTRGRGYALAPAVQITSGSEATPQVELVRFDVTYDEGDVGS